MLARCRIIAEDDAKKIVRGLQEIKEEIESGDFPWRTELEDIHMNVERRLFEKIGDTAGKLHTARSRNDQVAVDMRMYAKEAVRDVLKAIHGFRNALVDKAASDSQVVMPGYTHLQRAQPVLFAHHMLAYFEMLGRDAERFRRVYQSTDVMPLGSGALAGVPYPVDREYIAQELGFGSISSNSMDAVADRDFIIEFHSAAAICMMHLSRLSEELVIWSSEEFGFVRLGDAYTTGSSMMPQKRNPDFTELARGRSGRVFGNLVALLTMMKGLPLTYNRDMQEDKEGFFDTVDVLTPTLNVLAQAISTMEVRGDRMRQAARSGYLLATDVADYLVRKGMPFREAHGVVARLVAFALERGRELHELPLEAYRDLSDLFGEDVLDISADTSVEARDVYGGTAFSRVDRAIALARANLEADDGSC